MLTEWQAVALGKLRELGAASAYDKLLEAYRLGQAWRNVDWQTADGYEAERAAQVAKGLKGIAEGLRYAPEELEHVYLRTVDCGLGLGCIALVEAARTKEGYQSALQAVARALWRGQLDEVDFYMQLEDVIHRHLWAAYLEGMLVCGLTEDEMNTDEISALSLFINGQYTHMVGLALWIIEHNRASGGKLAAVFSRLAPWVNRWDEAFGKGQGAACKDQKAVWTLGAAEHCFVAGTLVSMADRTLKPIEQVAVGERVLTSVGARAVTKIWARDYQGPMVRVQADGREVLCTPNHPFLSVYDKSWRRADQLQKDGLVVCLHDWTESFSENEPTWLTNKLTTVEHGFYMDTRVYNLEVEDFPEYFANGFLVHNCSSCLKLAGKVKRMSYWMASGILPAVAGASYLVCGGWACACSLQLTKAPLSKGPLPHLP